MSSSNFFAELKRRNVYKIAVAYTVVGWLLVQVTTQVFPIFDIPNWALRLIVLAIIIGFPIALVIAWAFELTPEGLRRTEVAETEHGPKRPRRHAWIYVVIIAGAISVGLFFVGRYTNSKQSAKTALPAKSIAVLPFENLSHDPNNAYFADGIQDEILSTIGKIGDLKVISRTSTAKYKSRPENLRSLASELAVAAVLEGSVQKAGDRVRIIVQLIDAQTDAHLWSETYDRELKDIFSVESEVAQNIAGALKAKLTPEATQELDRIPTRDVEAYNLYLKAGYYVREASERNGDPAVLFPKALELYAQAITKDPSFALAWAQVSYVHSRTHWYSVDDSPVQVQLAEDAVRRAIALNPNLPEAHLALGYIAYWCKRDYANALAEFEQTLRVLPNDARVISAIAFVYRRQGQLQSALDQLYRATALDPQNASLMDDIGSTFAMLRRYPEALEQFHRSTAIQPGYWTALTDAALVHTLSNGRIDRANEALAEIPTDLDPQGQVRYARFKIAMWARDFAQAVKILTGAPDWLRTSPGHRPVATSVLLGQALTASGQIEEARSAYERAIPVLARAIDSGAGESSIYASLGQAYAGLGRKEDALREGKKAVELLPVAADAFDGPAYLKELAQIQARVGNVDEALSLIQQLLDMPAGFVVSPAILKLDPAWDPLRNDPRFQKLCEEKQK